MEDFQSIPSIIADDVFNQAFEKAELAKFDQTELANYENSLKIYRDLKSVIDTAYDEGKLEGAEVRSFEIAKSAKLMGMNYEEISKLTGLSIEAIEKL